MSTPKRSVAVRLRGQEFHIRSDEDEQSLQRVAGFLDQTMAAVEAQTGTVDSLDVSLLTGLNLARQIVKLREGRPPAGAVALDPKRLRSLIELAESALELESR